MFNIERMKEQGFDDSCIQICEKINANNDKKSKCTGHIFNVQPNKTFRFICSVCGYECDNSYYLGYIDGKRHEYQMEMQQQVQPLDSED